MSSTWGDTLKLSLFGESHGPAIGATLDGLPPGQAISLSAVKAFMQRRAPGYYPWSTKRKETDVPEIIAGYYQLRTTGTPLTAIIKNHDTRSGDYANLVDQPRPGHADLTGYVRYQGANDPRGGGHFSARLTAPWCFAGAVCLQILERQGIRIYAHVQQIADVEDPTELDPVSPDETLLRSVASKSFPVLDDKAGEAMIERVSEARDDLDSVGGQVRCTILGLPIGLGSPIFGGLEPRLASMIYGIPAVKALTFGDGTAIFRRRGSENNDSPHYDENGELTWLSNHNGGADGGISNSLPLIFTTGFKPASSISKPQPGISLSEGQNKELVIKGRHDPCVVPRAVPIVEASAAIVILDALLASNLFDPTLIGDSEL